MYLGRLFSLANTHDVELKNRIDRAWRKFAVFNDVLTNKSYSLSHRLRLFQATVQPTMLYACCCWVLTKDRAQKVRTLQRRMLRRIIGIKRKVSEDERGTESGEPWGDWMQRSTRIVESTMQNFGLKDWVAEVHRRKFRWAGHVARRTDDRWTKEVLDWTPVGHRRRGRPLLRWTDSIESFFETLFGQSPTTDDWFEAAKDRSTWKGLEEEYIKTVML